MSTSKRRAERPLSRAARNQAVRRAQQRQQHRDRLRKRLLVTAAVVAAAVIVLFLLTQQPWSASSSNEASSPAGGPSYAVGSPGPGEAAPDFSLESTAGGRFSLKTALRGGSVLLYFQEGLSCQPCWDQLRSIQQDRAQFRALGVARIVSITTDPLDQIQQKARDEGLTIPVLSDPDLQVSRAYDANHYGMMGDSRDGHSFVLVQPDGQIRWRADYGGAPDYTMYVKDADLLAAIRHAGGGG